MTEHVTALEAADILGVSLNQIRQLTFQRKLVVTAKRGRTVLYDLDTIKAYHPNKLEGDTQCPPATTSEPQPNESAATQAVGLYDYSSTI
jgi:phage terminase Nu1 subunit (DNA packaging protein)